MPGTGKCPHCDRVLPHIELEDIDIIIIEGSTSKYQGKSLVCPLCHKILQVELTPIPEQRKVGTVTMQKVTGV